MSAFSPRFAAICAAALCLPGLAAAQTQLVTNGTFANLTTPGGAAYEIDTQAGTSTDISGWTSTGYAFVFTPNSATSTSATGGAYSPQFGNYLTLYGAANGGATGNSWNGNSPQNSNFFASDGAYESGPLTQTINNLTIGTYYLVTFSWAGAQQTGFSGQNYEGWQVCLGSTCNGTNIYSNASHGFSGWMNASFAFKASAATETLSFLAIGMPSGVPPFSLLDNVGMIVDMPEPGALALLGLGSAALLAARRQRALSGR